jgi:hypothetical protein
MNGNMDLMVSRSKIPLMMSLVESFGTVRSISNVLNGATRLNGLNDWNEAPRWNDWNYFPTFACCLPPRAFFYFEH